MKFSLLILLVLSTSFALNPSFYYIKYYSNDQADQKIVETFNFRPKVQCINKCNWNSECKFVVFQSNRCNLLSFLDNISSNSLKNSVIYEKKELNNYFATGKSYS